MEEAEIISFHPWNEILEAGKKNEIYKKVSGEEVHEIFNGFLVDVIFNYSWSRAGNWK